jgi:methyl-accepting chemotaxis protein
MFGIGASKSKLWPLVGILVVFGISAGVLHAQSSADAPRQRPAPAFNVNGSVALASLISLSDNHLLKLAQSLEMLAATPEARSGDWEKIKDPLRELGRTNVEALLWFARPDGSYWSVPEGKSAGTLADRTYFPRLLAGKRVLGDLVVSKATGKSTGVVAVPVFRRDGSVAGVLGSSVYLDRLSKRIEQEMDLDDSVIFFSFDAEPLLALVYDPSLIFVDPNRLGAEVSKAFTEMRSRQEGVVTYTFRNRERTVLYRKSPVTGWWYGFGSVQSNESPIGEQRGELPMASYIVLFSFTEQGIEKIKESPGRVERAKRVFQEQGATVKEFYGVLGAEFDTMFIAEAPSDEAIAKAVLTVGSLGFVRTRTLRAFNEAEFGRLVSELP